jgi:transcriptional regulator with XRE-family HTH domain
MRVPDDIDSGDRHQRGRLARNLIKSREAAGVTTEELGRRLGVTGTAVAAMERRRTWEVRTVQAWARALGRRLHLELVDLDVPDDLDVDLLTYEAARETATDPADVDRAELRIAHRNLVRVRYAADVSDVEMGHRLGITDNAVRYFDQHPDGVSLVGLQRYARALGGRLRPTLNRRAHRPQRDYLSQPEVAGRLAAANAAASGRAAARDAARAAELLAADPHARVLTGSTRTFVQARADHPSDTLGQLAERCGVSKDLFAARLRRALAHAPTVG